jgi:hypothetical protein
MAEPGTPAFIAQYNFERAISAGTTYGGPGSPPVTGQQLYLASQTNIPEYTRLRSLEAAQEIYREKHGNSGPSPSYGNPTPVYVPIVMPYNILAVQTAAMADYRELEKKQREARNLAESMLKSNHGVGTIVTVAGLAQYRPSASYNAAVDEQRKNFQKQYGGIIKTGPDTYKYVNAHSLSSGYSCDKIFTDNAEINGGGYYAEKTRGQCMAYQSNLKYWDDFAKAEAQKAKERDARLAAEAVVFQRNQEALGFAKPAVVATTALGEKKLIAATANDIELNALAAAASRKAAQDAILKATADLKNLTINSAVPDSKTGVEMISTFVAVKLLDVRGAIEKEKKTAAATLASKVKAASSNRNKLAKLKGSKLGSKKPLNKLKK